MSDLILEQLRVIRAENAARHEDIMSKLDNLGSRVSSLENRVSHLDERVSSIETIVVRQQRELYKIIDRLEST